jgi:hypothetical protein
VNWFCKHKWQVFSVAHIKPERWEPTKNLRASRARLLDIQNFIIRQRRGATLVVTRCAECGKLDEYALSGIHEIPVEYKVS